MTLKQSARAPYHFRKRKSNKPTLDEQNIYMTWLPNDDKSFDMTDLIQLIEYDQFVSLPNSREILLNI